MKHETVAVIVTPPANNTTAAEQQRQKLKIQTYGRPLEF
jgi:hypothetical protein